MEQNSESAWRHKTNTFVDKKMYSLERAIFIRSDLIAMWERKPSLSTTKDKYVVRLNTPSIAGEYNNPGSSVYGSKLSASELNEGSPGSSRPSKRTLLRKGMSEYEKGADRLSVSALYLRLCLGRLAV